MEDSSLENLLSCIFCKDLSLDTITKIAQFGLPSLANLSVKEITEEFSDLNNQEATKLNAALRIGLKLLRESKPTTPTINKPEDALILLEDMQYYDQEHFVELLLGPDNRFISRETIALGKSNRISITPREVFKFPLRRNASKIILVHNHPENEPDPSFEDFYGTESLIEAGKLMEIAIVDHIIIGKGNYLSFREMESSMISLTNSIRR